MAVTITSDGGGPTAAISLEEGIDAVTTVVATRPALTFAKTGGADQALYTLNTGTGALSLTSTPDYSSPADADTNNTYVVEVTVTDPVSATTDSQIITTTVTENTSQSADFLFFQAKLDAFAADPTAWYSDADNNAPLTNPYPGLMTVADGYNRFPTLAGLVKAFRVTGDDTYAQIAYDGAVEYINDGRNRTSDSFLDWYAGEYNPSGGGYNHDHYEWRAAAGIGMLLTALIDEGGTVATVGNKQTLAEFLRDHVWLKWQVYAIEGGTANEDNVNTQGSHMVGRIGLFVIALDKYYGSAEYGAWMYGRGSDIGSMIQANIVGGVCQRQMGWSDNTHGVADTSHSGDVVQFVVEAYEQGYTWATLAIVQALGNGLNTLIWDDAQGGFHAYTDGTGVVNSSIYGFNMGGYFSVLPYAPAKLSEIVAWAKTTAVSHLDYETGAWMNGNIMKALAE